MEITLEKIDQIVERTGVSYSEAKEALELNAGDIIEALIYIEKKEPLKGKKINEVINEKANDMLDSLKEVLRKGNVSRVIVEKDGDVIINMPVTVGVLGLVLAPIAALVGASAAVVTNYKIKIVKDDGEVLDLNDMTEEKFSEIKEKVHFKKEEGQGEEESAETEKQEDIQEKDDTINLDK